MTTLRKTTGGVRRWNADLRCGRQVVALAFLAVGGWYLIWWLGTFNLHARAFSLTLWLAELFGFVSMCLFLFTVWKITRRKSPAANVSYSIDVFVPTLNEPVEIARRTVIAAGAMTIPSTIWLLDDGDRPGMRELAGELGVRYLARQTSAHAKAGNLNHGLLHATGELVAFFDVDQAPCPEFLAQTIGWFDDSKVGLVQTAQGFYNTDSFQHCSRDGGKEQWNEQTPFYHLLQRGKDYWNAAYFCGSGAVIRRSALDGIGGIAQGAITRVADATRAYPRGSAPVGCPARTGPKTTYGWPSRIFLDFRGRNQRF